MACDNITLSYGGLSIVFEYWQNRDRPRSRRTFVTESTYSSEGNLLKTGTSFELPYDWNINVWLYQAEIDKAKLIWETLDYSRRNERPAIALDVNVTSNVFSSTGHPYQDNDVVTLTTTGSLPAPLVSTRDYWVVERATNSFKLSESPNGTAIDITTTGSNSTMQTQLFVRLDDESEEICERNVTAMTKTRSEVAGTTVREVNGSAYYFARFLADWVEPPVLGERGKSLKTGQTVQAVSLLLQDTRVKI